MEDIINNIDINQYLPAAITWATNILLAIAILLAGLWLAGKVRNLIIGLCHKYTHLDDTLFRFFAF